MVNTKKQGLRVVRISIPLYQKILKRASTKGYTLTTALEKIMESYERKIKTQEKELYRREEAIAKALNELIELQSKIKHFPIGKCKYCGKPLLWDLTSKEELERLEEVLKGWFHPTCKPEK